MLSVIDFNAAELVAVKKKPLHVIAQNCFE